MEQHIKTFWEKLIAEWGIEITTGKITKGIFRDRYMHEVYNYFAEKAWDYPSLINFFYMDLINYDEVEDICDEMPMHPKANHLELAWGCNMEFDT